MSTPTPCTNVKPHRTNAEPPYWPLSDDGSGSRCGKRHKKGWQKVRNEGQGWVSDRKCIACVVSFRSAGTAMEGRQVRSGRYEWSELLYSWEWWGVFGHIILGWATLAVKALEAGKASADCDEIRPEMLKALNRKEVLWLTHVCQVAWCSARAWMIIPINTKRDRNECNNYRGLSLLSLPDKLYAKFLETRCREII